MKKIITASLLIVGLMFQSCSKDDDDNDNTGASQLTKTELLCSTPWKMVSSTLTPGVVVFGVTVTDMFSFMDDCQKDNLTEFVVGGLIEIDENLDVCEGEDQTSTGAWELSTDETKLEMTVDGLTETFDLITLTEQSLITEVTRDVMGQNVTVRLVFEHE
jgi:hypothetical protein